MKFFDNMSDENKAFICFLIAITIVMLTGILFSTDKRPTCKNSIQALKRDGIEITKDILTALPECNKH